MNLEKVKYGRVPDDDGSPSPTADDEAFLGDAMPLITLTAAEPDVMDDLLLQPSCVVDPGGGPSPTEVKPGRRDPTRRKRRWWKQSRLSVQSSASQGHARRHNRRRERLNTELLVATAAGDLREVERCLRQGASHNATCSLTWAGAVHVSALGGHAAVLGSLLSGGADASPRTRDGATALHLAAWRGDAQCAELLLGAAPGLLDVRLKPGPGQLMDDWRDSCQHDHATLADTLPTLHKGSTPLHVASQRANAGFIRVLLEHGADVAATDEDGLAPLDVIGELLSANDPDRSELSGSISALLEAGAWTAVDEEEEEDVESVKRYRTTPVHSAVRLRDLQAVQLLADSEVSPLVFDVRGRTPVHAAVADKLPDCLKVVLKAYESNDASIVDVFDIEGQTALHLAVHSGWLEGACILLEAGADVSVRDRKMGLTAVHIAAEKNRPDILQEFVVMEDVDISTLNIPDNTGDTPLALAVESNSLPCVKLLLQEGADVSKVIADNSTVLHRAAKYNEPDILQELLQGAKSAHPALLNAPLGITGETALHLAARSGNLRCCELLLEAGCDAALQSVEQRADTPLHLAAAAGHADVVQLLLEKKSGALELEDAEGRTPLLLACRNGSRDCARLLIQAGADLSAHCKESEGRVSTAMDYLFTKTPQPVPFLRDVLDGALSINDYPPDDRLCEVTLNFSVLTPSGRHVGQMKVMDAFVNTGNTYHQRTLLLHPLVKSFLFLKWRRLMSMFYVILLDFLLFVLALTALCCDLYLLPDRDLGPLFPGSVGVWRTMTFIFLGLFFLQEVAHSVCFPKFYMTELESWLKWICFVLATITASVDRDDDRGWRRDVAAVSVLLSWTEFMFLLSRLPTFGYFVLMFFKVAENLCKVLLTFALIFLGFALSFMILFRGEPPFTSPLHSAAKVVVMMTGELDYSDMFGDSVDACARLVFVLFVLLVGVVLMNLMVGLAVSDISELESKGLIGRLRKQVDFLRMLEYFLYSEKALGFLPRRAAEKVVKLRNVKEVHHIHPGRTDGDISDVMPSDLRHEIMVHVLDKKRSDTEYTLKDVYEKICNISDDDASPKVTPHKEQNFLDALANMKEDLEDIRKHLLDRGGRRLSASQPGPIQGKIDTLLEKTDRVNSTLQVILNQLSNGHHVINVT